MIDIVPVIYDLKTKRVLKWFELDRSEQLLDPAFNASNGQGCILIPRETYDKFGRSEEGIPALHDIQAHVYANAP